MIKMRWKVATITRSVVAKWLFWVSIGMRRNRRERKKCRERERERERMRRRNRKWTTSFE